MTKVSFLGKISLLLGLVDMLFHLGIVANRVQIWPMIMAEMCYFTSLIPTVFITQRFTSVPVTVLLIVFSSLCVLVFIPPPYNDQPWPFHEPSLINSISITWNRKNRLMIILEHFAV